MAAGRGRPPLQSPAKAGAGPRKKNGQEISQSPSKAAAFKVKAPGNAPTPGVAVVSADWLLQLRNEVENVHSIANSPTKHQKLAVPVASTNTPTTLPAHEKSPQRAARRVSVGVGSTPPPDIPEETSEQALERLKSQSTQTHGQMQETEMLAKAIVSPVRAEIPGKPAITQVTHVTPTPQVSPQISPSAVGRCDLFGNDLSHADRERERRQLQAQMLAEQVEEQRRRKEGEKQRLRQQELEDERRIEREQRELQEHHLREQRRGAPPDTSQISQPEKSVGKETLTKPLVERRRLAVEGGEGADHGPKRRNAPSQRTTAAANSLTGPWAHPDGNNVATNGEGRERRRRRRRRTSTNYDSTWRSGNRGTFHETKDSAGYATPPDRAHSKSPTHWYGTAEYEAMGSDTVGKIEKELQRTVEAKQRRRRTRERIMQREPHRDREDRDRYDRHDRSYESQWMNSPPGRSLVDTRGDVDDPRRRRRSVALEQASSESRQQIHDLPLTYEGRMPPKMTEEDLRQQLGSLVSLCEQLLQERAERERLERAPRSERGGRHSGGQRSERLASQPPMVAVGGSARNNEPTSARSHTSHSVHGGQQSAHGRSGVHESVAMPYGDSHSIAHDDISNSIVEHVAPIRVNGRLPPPMTINEVSAMDVGQWPPDALESLVADECRQPVQGLHDLSPFAAPHARGMSVRRHSQIGYSPLMSPPPLSRGGLNVQANFPGFGRSLLAPEDPVGFRNLGSSPDSRFVQNDNFGVGPPAPLGPGHIPIGIRPSIQAQSAMLRELYPHGPNGMSP